MKKNGFAILYTMLIIAIALSVTLGVASLVYRERALSRIGRDSLSARASADVGMECMLYKDKMPTQFDPIMNPTSFPMNCGRDSMGNTIMYIATLASSTPSAYSYNVAAVSSPDGPCYKAYIQRDLTATPITTKIEVYGYNICDSTNSLRVERGIIAEY